MKIAVSILLVALILTGCTGQNDTMDPFMQLRKDLLVSADCSFQATVTADYFDSLYTFQMDCVFDGNGTLSFTVTDPDTIAGITGVIAEDRAGLTFDDKVLTFPLLAEGQLTPVSAPWIFLNALRSGYMSAVSREQDGYCLYIDDSYEENPLHLEVYTDIEYIPLTFEIVWNNRRILSADIRNFSVQ